MVSTGMIFQFDTNQDTGLIMLSSGDKKEFSLNNWIDDVNQPRIGLEILYEENDNLIKIKMLNEDEKALIKEKAQEEENQNPKSNENILSTLAKEESNEEDAEFDSVDDYIEYFTNLGYKLLNDFQDQGVRKAMLRKFSVTIHEEIKISYSGSKISITKMINGKKV